MLICVGSSSCTCSVFISHATFTSIGYRFESLKLTDWILNQQVLTNRPFSQSSNHLKPGRASDWQQRRLQRPAWGFLESAEVPSNLMENRILSFSLSNLAVYFVVHLFFSHVIVQFPYYFSAFLRARRAVWCTASDVFLFHKEPFGADHQPFSVRAQPCAVHHRTCFLFYVMSAGVILSSGCPCPARRYLVSRTCNPSTFAVLFSRMRPLPGWRVVTVDRFTPRRSFSSLRPYPSCRRRLVLYFLREHLRRTKATFLFWSVAHRKILLSKFQW